MNKTRFMKRIFSLLMALVLTLALMPINMLTLHAEGTDETEEPEITETITDDAPAAVDDTYSEAVVPDDAGNSYEVSYDSGDYSVPEEQNVNDVPYTEPVAQAAKPVTVPVVEPEAEPIAEIVAEPVTETVTEAASESTAEEITGASEEIVTEAKADLTDEVTTETASEPVAEVTTELMDEPSAEEVTELESAETVTFTVTFDANGHGTAPEAVTADKDGTVSEPSAPSEDGYTFTGWYKDADAAEQWDFAADKVTENLTLYAGWSKDVLAAPTTESTPVSSFTVTFDANGHGIAPEAVTASQDALIAEPAALSEDGYTFTGWYRNEATTEVWNFSTDKVVEDITLYAGWSEEVPKMMLGAATRSAGTYTIEYVDLSDWLDGYPPDGDYMTGNWPENTTAVAGTVVSLPHIISGPYPVEKLFGEGYVTYTWEWLHVVPRGSGNSAADNILDASTGTFVMPESDVIVRGAWTYGDSIQIFPYATEGGRVSHDGRNASWAESSYITLTAIPDPDYYFVGWKHGDENNPSGPIISTQNPWRFQAIQDIRYERYYAIFAKQVPHSIKIYNGTADKTSAIEGETITITAMEPSGLKAFDAWWAEEPSTLQFADENSTQTTFVMPRADVEVWATYKDLYSITVQESEGGTGTVNSSFAAVGETVTLTASPNGGWRFDYWEVVSGDVELTDSSSAKTTLTLASNMEDVVVKPHFYHVDVVIVLPPSVTVQESEGGTAVADQQFAEAGMTVTLTATPRGGHIFDHWEVVSGGVELADSYSAETTFVANGNDVVVKPHFERLEVIIVLPPQTVTYKVVNGTWADGTATDKTEEVDYGRNPAQIPTGMKPSENYDGGAWDTDPTNATITEETTFTYAFKPISTYTVTYKVVNGTWSDGTTTDKMESVANGSSPVDVPTGMIAGQGFADGAWDTDPVCASIIEDTTFTYTFGAAIDPSGKQDIELEITVHDAVYGDEIVCIVSSSRDGEYALTIADRQVTVTVNGGLGSYNVGVMDAGTYQAYIIWDGDADYNSAYAQTIFTVYPVGTNFTVTADPAEVTEGDTVTIIPTLPADATGTVKYYLGTSTDGELLGERPVGVNLELSAENGNTLPAGTHAITASYSGDSLHLSAVKNVLVIVNPLPAAKPILTITAKDQTYTYNGQPQGEGDTAYDDPAAIAEKVTVEGLKDGDTLTGIIIDGQGQEAGAYELTPSAATINGVPASDKYNVIYKAGTLTIIKVEYTFSAGADITWTKGSSTGIDYTINRNYEDDKTFSLFESIEVDGTVVSASNYTAAAGSLNVTLKPSYLNTLSNGRHSVKINFMDGSAETALTIKPKPKSDTELSSPAAPAKPEDPSTSKVIYVPNTGDSSNPGLWFTLLLLSLISLVGLMAYRKEFTE